MLSVVKMAGTSRISSAQGGTMTKVEADLRGGVVYRPLRKARKAWFGRVFLCVVREGWMRW